MVVRPGRIRPCSAPHSPGTKPRSHFGGEVPERSVGSASSRAGGMDTDCPRDGLYTSMATGIDLPVPGFIEAEGPGPAGLWVRRCTYSRSRSPHASLLVGRWSEERVPSVAARSQTIPSRIARRKAVVPRRIGRGKRRGRVRRVDCSDDHTEIGIGCWSVPTMSVSRHRVEATGREPHDA